MIYEYKALCSKFPPDREDLAMMDRNGWEFIGVCTFSNPETITECLSNTPAHMKKRGEPARYTWYFRRANNG